MKNKNKSFVYILEHVHIIGDCEDVKTIGIFSSKKKAIEAKKNVGKKRGFNKRPRGFHISKYEVGFIHWTKGFVTVSH